MSERAGIKEIHCKLFIPIFGYRVNIIYTNDIQHSREKRAAKLGPLDKPLCKYVDGMHSYIKQEPECFIFFTPKTTFGVISHEVAHCIFRMYRFYGEGRRFGEENFCYHLDYILDKIVGLLQIMGQSTKNQNPPVSNNIPALT